VVDIEAAKRRLQRVENIADLDTEHLRLVAIDVEIDLRRVGGIGAEHPGKLGLLIGRNDQSAKHRRDVVRSLTLQRLQHVLKTAGAAQAENGRQVERKRNGAFNRRQLRSQSRNDRI